MFEIKCPIDPEEYTDLHFGMFKLIQREEFRADFFACYDCIWELINLRNDKQHYHDGLFVFDIPTFNERVARESLLNAVSHRNYQLNGRFLCVNTAKGLLSKAPVVC